MSKRLSVPTEKTVRRVTRGVTGETWESKYLALTVRLEHEDLSARDFSSFLAILDSAYGRTAPGGFLSYAHRPDQHLRISHIRPGSVELEIVREILTHLDLWGLVLAYLVIKVGPRLITGEAARNWGEAFQVWGEVLERRRSQRRGSLPARLTRSERVRLRKMISEVPRFEDLDRRDLDRLVSAVETVLVRERRHLRSVARFSAVSVKEVSLEVIDEAESGSSDN